MCWNNCLQGYAALHNAYDVMKWLLSGRLHKEALGYKIRVPIAILITKKEKPHPL